MADTMASWCSGLFIVIFSAFLGSSLALQCGEEVCLGSDAYCCGDECCFNYDVWNFWWFWMLLVFIFVLIVSCVYCCHRRRLLRNPDYVVVRGPDRVYGQPVYGTVGNTDTAPIIYGPGQVVSNPNVPVMTGQYMQAYNAVPPAYSPAVQPPAYPQAPADPNSK